MVALIAFFCLCLVLYKRSGGPQTEPKSIDAFDLPTEPGDEDESEDEEENFFDIDDRENGTDSGDLLDTDECVRVRLRGGVDPGMHFDSE
jgi:hypothetical protein